MPSFNARAAFDPTITATNYFLAVENSNPTWLRCSSALAPGWTAVCPQPSYAGTPPRQCGYNYIQMAGLAAP